MIKDALSSIDLFGTPIAVSFSGKEKYRSKYGGSCSLLVLGFVIWAVYNASQELFTNKNPKVTTSETYTDNPRELTLTRDNFPVAFGLQAPDSKNFTIFKNDSIYKFQIIQVMFNRTILEDGTLKEDIQITNVPTENCTPGHFGELASSFTSLDLRNMYCIARDSNSDYKEVKIVGVGESLFYRGFTVQVSQCINATNSTTEGNCATQPVIDSWLAGSWLNAYYGNMVVDGQNYSRPDSRYRDRYYTMISPANYVYATIYLGRVEVSTDSGWLTSNTKKKEYIQIDKIDDYLQTGSRDDKILIHVNFETSKLEKTYARSYKKLQNVLAEVAALANIALIVVFLLLAPYSRLKFRETLINELFDFQENSTPKNSKKVIKGIMKKSHYINTLEMQPTESLQSEPRVSTKPTKKELYIKTSIPMSTEAAETIQFRSMDSSPGIFEKKTRFELPEDDASSKKDSFTLSPRNLSLIEPKVKTKKTIAQRRQEFKRLSHFSHSNRMRKSVRMAASLPTIHIKSKKSIIDTMSTYQSFQRTESQFGPVSGAFSNKLNSKKPESKALEELEDDNMKDVNYDEQIDHVDHADNDEEDLNAKQHTTERNLLTEERITHINRNNTMFLHGKRKASPRYGKKYEEADDEADEKVYSEEEQEAEHRIFIKTGQEPEKINLSIGEYLMSFLYRPPKLKRKMKILSEGVKNINDRLDILNLLKKVREIDKLKALLLDHDQLLLFNLLPKPKLKQEKGNDGPRSSFSLEQLREPKFIEESRKEDALRESYKRIKRKNYKTDIDRKLLETIEALRNDI